MDERVHSTSKQLERLRWTVVSGILFVGMVLISCFAYASDSNSVKELSETAALSLAEKYFGSKPSMTPDQRVQFSIDPVTPFYNAPDPDAPSESEMRENFSRTQALTLNSFFIPPPSPMYESASEPSLASSKSIPISPMISRAKKAVHQQALSKLAKSTVQVVKEQKMTQKSQMLGKKSVSNSKIFDSGESVFGNLFKDNRVALALPKTQLKVSSAAESAPKLAPPVEATQTVSSVPKDVPQEPSQPSTAKLTGPSQAPKIAASAASEKQLFAHVSAAAAGVVPSGGKNVVASVDYHGMLGDPFHDHVVALNKGHSASTSWFSR